MTMLFVIVYFNINIDIKMCVCEWVNELSILESCNDRIETHLCVWHLFGLVDDVVHICIVYTQIYKFICIRITSHTNQTRPDQSTISNSKLYFCLIIISTFMHTKHVHAMLLVAMFLTPLSHDINTLISALL